MGDSHREARGLSLSILLARAILHPILQAEGAVAELTCLVHSKRFSKKHRTTPLAHVGLVSYKLLTESQCCFSGFVAVGEPGYIRVPFDCRGYMGT